MIGLCAMRFAFRVCPLAQAEAEESSVSSVNVRSELNIPIAPAICRSHMRPSTACEDNYCIQWVLTIIEIRDGIIIRVYSVITNANW